MDIKDGGVICLLITSHQCMKVLFPRVGLPLGPLPVIPEHGHCPDTRFALRGYTPSRASSPPNAHIRLFLTGTRFLVPCVSRPQVSGQFPLGLLFRSRNNHKFVLNTLEGKDWKTGDDFPEGHRKAEVALPQGRGPEEAAEWVWLWSCTLPKEEGG